MNCGAERASLAGFAAHQPVAQRSPHGTRPACLEATANTIAELAARTRAARQGFVDLPRLEADDGRVPVQ
jgi:hypothetical protein